MLQLTHLEELCADEDTGIQVVRVQGLCCTCSFQELGPEAHWCLLWQQPEDLLVDSSGDGGHQAFRS